MNKMRIREVKSDNKEWRGEEEESKCIYFWYV